MCGIAGMYGSFEPSAKKKAAGSFLSSLRHRGPDGSGVYEDEAITLVHTRLSIIDLSENGNQPLYNEDKSIALICNGEIYNYQQIRAGLVKKGHHFSSNSDCEVILHLYEENSDDLGKVLHQLTGMFAFALWDIAKKRLFIARDRVGIKPLYYSYENGKLLFSSEVKSLAESGLTSVHNDYTSLYEYFLLGSIPGPNTLYKEIKSLEAGHYLTIEKDSQPAIHQYWDIPEGLRKWNSENEILDEVEDLLSAIVRDHLIADVPVGTFLSAGVDSSLITAIAVSNHPGIHSFTASFPGEPEDEGTIAADTAKKLQTTHHAYPLKSNFFNDFPEQFKDLDQPFAVTSSLALGRLSKMAKQEVKVVLSGDGGDELFGGYHRYESPKQPSFLKFIPGVLQQDVLKLGSAVTGKKSLDTLAKNLQTTQGKRFFDKVLITDTKSALSVFGANIIEEIDQERYLNRVCHLFEKRKDEDALNAILYTDMKTTLVDEMLTKCDRMTMINGIEGRVPLLDHRLVELAFSIPGAYKRKNGTGKLILRKLLAKRLGSDLAFRAKTGFNSPLKQWLTNDPQTIAFVKNELSNMRKFDFVNASAVDVYEKENNIDPPMIFSLVCLNHFLNSENFNFNR